MTRRRLIAALFVSLSLSGCQGLGNDQEYSYKWGKLGPRYLADFLKPEPLASLGNLGDYTAADKDVSTAVRRAGEKAQALGAITAVSEDIYLVLGDRPGVGFTVGIHNGDVDVREGLREGIKPSLVLTLTRKEALELPDLLGSRSLDAQGRVVTGLTADNLFKLVKLLLVPAIRSLYSSDPLYQGGNRSALGFDDFIQVEVTPPTGSEMAPARITVLNADGQWLFLEGWHGDPDERVSLTVPQALEIYRYAAYDLKKAKTPTDKQLISAKYAELRKSAVVYTRPDHK